MGVHLVYSSPMSETLDRTEMMAPPVKFPKKKVALVLAYLGTNYQGMQMYVGWPFILEIQMPKL